MERQHRLGPSSGTPCRYGRECLRRDCHFLHQDGRNIDRQMSGAGHHHSQPPHQRPRHHPREPVRAAPAAHQGGSHPCRYDRRCMRPDCHFYHPNGRIIEQPPVHTNQPRSCRYGAECYRENCPFLHPERTRRFPRKRNFMPNKIPVSSASYTSQQLQDQEARGFKSAGILPYRKGDDNKIWVLLGLERRYRSDPTLFLNFLGGMRDRTDRDAADTAVRELYEETGSLLGQEKILAITQNLRQHEDKQADHVFWIAVGKYVLFSYELTHDLDIHERYNTTPKGSRGRHSEAHSLHWVSLTELLESIKQQKDQVEAESGDGLKIYSFLSTALADEAALGFLPVRLVGHDVLVDHDNNPATASS